MKRGLLAVGCDQYDYAGLDRLFSAEYDARRVYELLTKPNIGNYDPALSRLLLSPTLNELESSIIQILSGGMKLDTFTIFFAGHGTVNSVGFHMCLRDTRTNQLSGTAFWLGKLFSHIAEAGPSQSNIVIDACCSGGLVADLGVMPKSVTPGDADSPAVTMLAMAARNQSATEDEDTGGLGTNAFLDCISGRAFVQETSASLDLTEIAHIVVERLKGAGQNPTITSLNVHQRSIFCRNPHYQTTANSAFTKWNARAFLDAIEPVLSSQADSPHDLITSVERLSDPLITRARELSDRFREPEVIAASIGALLPFCGTYPAVEKRVLQQLKRVSDAVRSRMAELEDDIKTDKYAFVGVRGVMGDLFAIPIRLSKVIGWIGACYHIDKILGREDTFPREQFAALLDHLVAEYPLSLSVMSDMQAPYIALALSAANELALQSQAEETLGLLFNSVLRVKGKIADAHIEKERILAYLICRHLGDFSKGQPFVARPSETITVLLRCASLLNLQDVFDAALEDLDHLHLNAYIPDDYSNFAARHIEGGENASYMVGHGIWQVGDLEKVWPLAARLRPPSLAIQGGAITSSLIFPDRVPWFVLSHLTPTKELGSE